MAKRDCVTQAKKISLFNIQDNIHKALKLWHKTDSDEYPLDDLLLLQQAHRDGANSVHQATNEVILTALKVLETEAEEDAKLLRMRFLDEMPVFSVANQLNMAESTVHRMQKSAIEHLTKIIISQEGQLRADHRTSLEHRLELPTYDKLIGIEDHLDQLLEWLTLFDAPWLIAIEGLGGLGKTSLADAVCRQVINEDLFDDLGWVSARHRMLNLGGGIRPIDTPALTAEDLLEKLVEQLMADVPRIGPFLAQEVQTTLRARLAQQRHLIVIDNLETVTDIESLLPTLRDLANPSKFLLTSRESLHYESGVFHLQLPELNETNALRLIRHEAHLHNLPYLAEAGDDELKPIFQTVGGNPLALRLVAGQTHVYPLKMILSDLAAARGEEIETLYTFIYRQAWDHLNESTRQILLAMLLMPDRGGDLKNLSDITELDREDVVNALNVLVKLNLVNSIGGLNERRYTIHNLTRTFLRKQVAKW